MPREILPKLLKAARAGAVKADVTVLRKGLKSLCVTP